MQEKNKMLEQKRFFSCKNDVIQSQTAHLNLTTPVWYSSILQFKSSKLDIILPQTTVAVCHTQGSGSSYLGNTMAQHTQNMLVYSIRVSQGSLSTHFGCDRIFNGLYRKFSSESASKRILKICW